jgi:hypothetical protein
MPNAGQARLNVDAAHVAGNAHILRFWRAGGANDGKPIFAGVYDGDSQAPELAEMLECMNWRLRQE